MPAREDDAITVWNGIYVILDHCSASWSVDEVLSCTGKTDNLTTQWCYVTEALDDSIHSKGPHGFGSIVASYLPARLSWHHNLYAHNQSRNPRPGSYDGSTISFDFRNNVLYNWGYFCGYSAGSPEATDMNYVGNYLVKGPGSTTDSAFRGGGASTRIHQSGNKIDLNKNASFDGTDTGWSMFSGTYTQQASAFDFNQTNTTETADLALQRVLSQAGAMPWNRDTKDSAIAANVVAGTGGFVDTTAEAGGYPTLASTTSPPDNDLDGMPNNWESAFGSDPNVANHNADADARRLHRPRGIPQLARRAARHHAEGRGRRYRSVRPERQPRRAHLHRCQSRQRHRRRCCPTATPRASLRRPDSKDSAASPSASPPPAKPSPRPSAWPSPPACRRISPGSAPPPPGTSGRPRTSPTARPPPTFTQGDNVTFVQTGSNPTSRSPARSLPPR